MKPHNTSDYSPLQQYNTIMNPENRQKSDTPELLLPWLQLTNIQRRDYAQSVPSTWELEAATGSDVVQLHHCLVAPGNTVVSMCR